ncbi:RNA polymerase I-specific initiation factor-domain-containing protein [Tuber brumale]|nr:RNA polymerase I-specific initiation factor-domain-containing protein [Tuber brumale]
MNPSTDQRSYFALPTYPQNPSPPKRPPPASPPGTPSPPRTPPAAPAWTPINEPLSLPSSPSPSPSPEPSDNDAEVEHLSPKAIHRRGNHARRFENLLAKHSLTAPPAKPFSLRAKHLAVITTILHRTLLGADYPRAARAFALLIRCKGIDLRHLWSIGLDLLLRGPTTAAPTNANTEKAIEYLNRLILFYPYRPRIHAHHPAIISTARRKEGDIGRTGSASALEFYPALFRLRVMQPGGLEKVREEIEELMLTPPWPDMVGLWLMKGMVLNALADEERDLGRKEQLRAGAEECFDEVREKGGKVPEEAVWEEGMDDVEMVEGSYSDGDEIQDDGDYYERMDDSG